MAITRNNPSLFTMSRTRMLCCFLLLLLLASGASAFQSATPSSSQLAFGPSTTTTSRRIAATEPSSSFSGMPTAQRPFDRTMRIHSSARNDEGQTDNIDDDDDAIVAPSPSWFRRRFRSLRRRTRRWTVALAFAVAATVGTTRPATASAPVMALPKQQARDPVADAMELQRKKTEAATQRELRAMAAEAREIEANEGPAARQAFEDAFHERKQQEAQEKADGLVTLKRNLLDQGMCPFCDLEGRRAVAEYETGVNPETVPGTEFHLERHLEQKQSPKTFKRRKAAHRQVIQCMVKDMKLRGVDPLEYFWKHQDQTQTILELPVERAQALVEQYQANLEEYGQITKPKPGELSRKEQLERQKNDPAYIKAEKKRAKAEQKRLKAEQKAAEKARKKGGVAQVSPGGATAPAPATTYDTYTENGGTIDLDDDGDELLDFGADDELSSGPMDYSATATPSVSSSSKSGLVTKAVAGTVVVTGGGVVLTSVRSKRTQAEEKRQQELRQLMESGLAGLGGFNEEDDDDEDSNLLGDDLFATGKGASTSLMADLPEEIVDPTPILDKTKKKKRLGLFNKKKKNTRETDIMNLVVVGEDKGEDAARMSEFSMVMAKLLSFSAPKIFAPIRALPGDMPMQRYDEAEAIFLLNATREDAELTDQQCADAIANVVNCMLIDVVDVAASLKKKEDVIVATDVVVDFMNQAAGAFVALLGSSMTMDPPVTYGGTLGKGKLEKLYETYSSQMMEKMSDMSFMDRLGLLKDVFQISDGKAQGAMMKSMRQMMKDPKAMESMQQMMGEGGMGDMLNGMGGMEGMDPAMMDSLNDPEQLLEMLRSFKAMVDAGEIGPSELATLKSQFKEQFGEGIDDILKKVDAEGEELSDNEKELAELIKSITDA